MLPLLQTVLEQCRQRTESASKSGQCYVEAARQSDELAQQRTQFRAAAAKLMNERPETMTLPGLLERVPPAERQELETALAQLRRQADELVSACRRAAIFTRIHLDAYQRLLRDLTCSTPRSGRYGREGKAEAHDYRPLLQLNG